MSDNRFSDIIAKAVTYLMLVIFSVIISGIYGVLHDQITCSISPEYYTEFKFYQFGLYDEFDGQVPLRIGAIIVGFIATWWVGIPIGVILAGLVLFMLRKNPIKFFFKSILRVFVVAILFGLLGYLLAGNVFSIPIHFIPNTVEDVIAYEKVGIIHNFSYLGGLAGLVVGIIYIVRKKIKIHKNKHINLKS